jgi:pseudaminic acid cytidylyltransferase
VNAIAIIPARGGSERIPGKNIKPLAGVPILAYPIGAALASQQFATVMVSTDSPAIADIARQYGAQVPFLRSTENSSSRATTVAVLLEVVARYAELGEHFELGCCLYPCNPFLTPEKLIEGRRKLHAGHFDSVISAVRYGHPVQRSFLLEHERIRWLFPEHRDTRSQDLPAVLHDAAQFYWYRTDALLTKQQLWTDNAGIIELPESEVQDIDTLEDWKMAELKYQSRHAAGQVRD